MVVKKSFLCVLLFLILIQSSCKIRQGYEALNVYNYFKAKHKFEKSLKNNPSPAAFGLSVIYFRTDNPFHNIDSAYHYSIMAVENFAQVKPKSRIKLDEEFSVNIDSMTQHREKISKHFYELAREKNTIMAYASFKAKHPWSPLGDSALYFREELAFNFADEKGTSSSYQKFLKKYPETRYTIRAKELMENSQFNETVNENDLSTYQYFINEYPENRNVFKAHRYIYESITNDNQPESYLHFIENYPDSPHYNEAWRKYYRLSISDYRMEVIKEFEEHYPNFPFPEMIKNDLKLVGTKLFPFRVNEKYGYMDIHCNEVIPPRYTYSGFFSSGLALVEMNGKYGFIDKNNNLIVPFIYDEVQPFENGRAVVEKDGYMGWINTTGAYILPLAFEDIGFFSEGIIYAYKDDKYQYYNIDGKPLFDRTYDEAFNFSNNRAKVFYNDTVAFIDNKGNTIIAKRAKNLRFYANDLFVIEYEDSLNIINLNDSILLPRSVNKIGELANNRALYSIDGEFGYLDQNGQIAIKAKYDVYPNYFQFSEFKNNHAKIAKGNKYSLIDSLDKKILPAIFDNIGDFGELIPISKGNGWGYTDKSTRLIIRYDYDYAYPFIRGKAIVTKDGLSGVINTKNELVIPITYKAIQRLNKNQEEGTDLFFVYDNTQKFGIFDEEGKALTDIKYVRFNEVNASLLQLESSEGIEYFDIPNVKLITLSNCDE
jgi:hypothetical protein